MARACSTWSWGNKFLWNYSPSQDPQLHDTYQYLVSNGINWFDTADSYGTGAITGRSETLLGQFSSGKGKVRDPLKELLL